MLAPSFDSAQNKTGEGLPSRSAPPCLSFPASMNSNAPTTASQTATPTLAREIAEEIVRTLNLEVAPADIDPSAPLYGDALRLDSIDILEVALLVSRKYGFQLRANDESNVRIFGSLESLANHVAAHRTK